MTAKQLNNLFEAHAKRSKDFISWAFEVCGVSFADSEVSRHRNSGQHITRSFAALYTIYFRLIEESQNAVEANPLKKLL